MGFTRMHYKLGLTILILALGINCQVYADTIYLKNGRKVEGIIKSESQDRVELNIGFGVVGFNKKEVERIEKSSQEECQLINEKWERQKIETEKKLREQEAAMEYLPKKVEIFEENGQLVVEALLNRKVNVSLILDTGASIVLLLPSVAKKMGIDFSEEPYNNASLIQCSLADGRRTDAKRVIIESINVEGMEARNVEAAVLLNEVMDPKMRDGLLGMSFLKQFSFKVDAKNKKFTLEKAR